jgi:hypothetical protein
MRCPGFAAPLTNRWAYCAKVTPVPQLIGGPIGDWMAQLRPDESPCLGLPAVAFADARLLAACPHCSR